MFDQRPKLGDLQQYVIEWSVENSERYARLSKTIVGAQKQEHYDAKKGETQKAEAVNTIITCVLEVPRNQTERVTAALREAPHLRHASYLSHCADHADDAAALLDAQVKMRMTIEALEQLALSYASKLDELEKAPSKRDYVKNFYTAMDQIRKTIPAKSEEAVKDMRRALNEKRADVAAKMLSSMPDEDD